MRDDFKAATVLLLAKRSGFRCSNPDCEKPTIGAAPGHQGIVNVGVAAHITAASPKGPRYDATRASAERSDPSNGIWLCQDCAKVIDADPLHFSVRLLLEWKRSAEARSFLALSGDRTDLDRALHHAGALLSRWSEADRAVPPYLGSALRYSPVSCADISERRYAVGDVARWGRLLDGVYSPRPHLLRLVIEEYLSWISTTGATRQRRRLPVFWIEGRSGDGKSVLLLQLAASILSIRPDILVYQVSRPDHLPGLLSFVRGTNNDGRVILIVSDDLHRVTDSDAFEAALRSTLDQDFLSVAILACGPTPEKDAFVRASKGSEVYAWTMPSLTAIDLSIFSEWFGEHVRATGDLARTILVELLFVSNSGASIAAFAASFAQRLKTFDVFETVRNIVAINALDVTAPGELLRSVSERDSIERLMREDQLHFEWKDEVWGRGVRLVHGIIAWRLFDEWSTDPLRATSLPVRLARALASVLQVPTLPAEFGRQLMAGLSRRLQTLLELAPVEVDRCKRDFLDELMRAARDSSLAQSFPTIQMLAEYISDESAIVERRHVDVATRVLSDPSVPGVNRTLLAAQLSVLECSKRIVSEGHRERAEAMALDRVVGMQAAAAVQMLVCQAGSVPGLLDRWLAVHIDATPPKEFICAALNTTGARPATVAAALRWIKSNWHGRSGVEPLTGLIRTSRDVQTFEIARRWVAENPDAVAAGDVVAVLINQNRDNEVLRELATNWVAQHTKEARVLDVMSTLLRVQSKKLRSALRELTLTLFRLHRDDPRVTNLISRAVGGDPGNEEILALTIEWLHTHGHMTGAADVLSSLLRRHRNDEQIKAAALGWIASVPNSPQSAHVLSSLLRSQRQDAAMRSEALAWIRAHAGDKSTGSVISTLLTVAGDDEEVRSAAYEWANRHRDSPTMSHVLSSLTKADPANLEVRGIATNWSASNRASKLTGHLLSTLLRASDCEPVIYNLAIEWLTAHEDSREAAQLLSTLLFVTSGQSNIQQLARNWVHRNGHWRDAQHQLLAALVGTASSDAEFIDLSLHMIGDPKPEGEPPYLFEALAIAAPFSPAVEVLVRRFIQNSRNGVRQRQGVLESWIRAGGPLGPAFGLLCDLAWEQESRSSDAGRQVFGIMVRACARNWDVVLEALGTDPRRDHCLVYLVGFGIRSVRLDFEAFMLRIDSWPADELCYTWKGLLESSVSTDVFISALCSWLGTHWRRRGYGVVLRAIAMRMHDDPDLACRLPAQVCADVYADVSKE